MRSHTAQVRLRNACTCIYMTRYTHVYLRASIRVYNIPGMIYIFFSGSQEFNTETPH